MKPIASVLLFVLLFSIEKSAEGNIELVLIEGAQKTYYTRLCIGKPIQCLNVYLDFSHPFIWVNEAKSAILSDEKFDLAKSKTATVISTQALNDQGLNVDGLKAKDDIVFPQFTLNQVEMEIALKGSDFIQSKISGGLGLGFPSTDPILTGLSFMDELKNQKIINERVFTFQKITKDNGVLSIGKVPESFISDYTHLGRCDLTFKQLKESSKTRQWACLMDSIHIGDTFVFEDNQLRSLSFNLQENNIIVPISFLLFLERSYFKQAVDKGECSIIKEGNAYTFTCIKKVPSLPSISFKMRKWLFSLESKDLFYLYGNNYFFYMKAMTGRDEWVIGEAALIHFIVLFDVENNLFGLYNSKLIYYATQGVDAIPKPVYPISLPEVKNTTNSSTFKVLGVVLISICMVLGILLLLRSRKRARMFELYQKTSNRDELIY